MKILLVCDEYPPESPGGFGIFVKEFAHALSDHGHTVYVYGWYPQIKQREVRNDGSVQIFLDPKTKGLSYLKELREYGKAVSKLAVELAVDAVEMTDSAGKFLFVKHPNLCVRLHTSTRYFKARSFKMDMVEKLAFAFRKVKIIAVSQYIKSKFSSYYRWVHPSTVLEVVHNGIEPNNLQVPKERSKNIVFGGTLKPLKGIDVLIEAFYKSKLWENGYSLQIFGKDTQEEGQWYSAKLDHIIQGKGKSFSDKVILNGEISKAELLIQFATSFANVFPSRSESFGLVVIESMAQGALTVYTNQGAAKELINHGTDGFLFDVDAAEELKDCLITLAATHTQELDEIRENAYTKAKTFSIDSCVQKSLVIYDQS